MVGCWTAAEYMTHMSRPLAAHSTLWQSFSYALWTTSVEGAGPLVAISAMSAYIGRPDNFLWFAPLFGAGLYLVLATFLSNIGRQWSALVHLLIGLAWLSLGAIIVTNIFEK